MTFFPFSISSTILLQQENGEYYSEKQLTEQIEQCLHHYEMLSQKTDENKLYFIKSDWTKSKQMKGKPLQLYFHVRKSQSKLSIEIQTPTYFAVFSFLIPFITRGNSDTTLIHTCAGTIILLYVYGTKYLSLLRLKKEIIQYIQ